MKIAMTIVALSLVATSAFAGHAAREAAKEAIPLKSGGTLYIFKDGKMGKEDRFGRAHYLKNGEVLEATDGRSITVDSNEVARMDALLLEGHSSN